MRKSIQDRRPASSAGSDEHRPAGAQKLSLRRETLRELTLPELDLAAGGSPSSRAPAPEI